MTKADASLGAGRSATPGESEGVQSGHLLLWKLPPGLEGALLVRPVRQGGEIGVRCVARHGAVARRAQERGQLRQAPLPAGAQVEAGARQRGRVRRWQPPLLGGAPLDDRPDGEPAVGGPVEVVEVPGSSFVLAQGGRIRQEAPRGDLLAALPGKVEAVQLGDAGGRQPTRSARLSDCLRPGGKLRVRGAQQASGTAPCCQLRHASRPLLGGS
mmetsp:Transcript_2625/g.6592  ORF Transcript_2625/g.6592 Transcript_2625/m.6592 type:complete len:213 (+) Transcript_2625:231-869(+)